jgi:hypothetical protein
LLTAVTDYARYVASFGNTLLHEPGTIRSDWIEPFGERAPAARRRLCPPAFDARRFYAVIAVSVLLLCPLCLQAGCSLGGAAPLDRTAGTGAL